MSLLDRVEPWHALLVAAFLVGTGGSLVGGNAAGIAVVDVLMAALSGLLWAFAVYVFVGTVRNYVASYAETGGSLWDSRFLAPFVVGGIAVVAMLAWRLFDPGIAGLVITDALTVGFWAFVLAMIVMLTASYVVVGYREAQG